MHLNPEYTPTAFASESKKVQVHGSRLQVSGRRYYSPSQGRFVGRDPKQEEGGLNLYGFCRNNAINLWDVLGMDPSGNPMNGSDTFSEVVVINGVVYNRTWNTIGSNNEGDEWRWDDPNDEAVGTVDPNGNWNLGAGSDTLGMPDGPLLASNSDLILAQVLGAMANKKAPPPPDPLLSEGSLVAQIARIIYRETSSLRPINGRSTQADLQKAREMIAQIILNRLDTGLANMAVGKGTASAGAITGSELTAIAVNKVPSAVGAWESSVAAAKKLVEAYNLPPDTPADQRPAKLTDDLYWNMRPGTAVDRSVNARFGPTGGVAPDTWSPVFNSTSGAVMGPNRIYYYPGGGG